MPNSETQISSLLLQLKRLINSANVGSGSGLSQLSGETDVPYATNFRILRGQTEGQGPEYGVKYELGWLSVEGLPNVTYNIYAQRLGYDRTPLLVAQCEEAPAVVKIKPLYLQPTGVVKPATKVVFYIQTQLANGARNTIKNAPAVSDSITGNPYHIRFSGTLVGAASAGTATLPANPKGFYLVLDETNTTTAIPYYNYP